MSREEFNASLGNDIPPERMNKYLRVLWYDEKGDWDQAHAIAQDISDQHGAWLHAYLHRKEGDQWNAEYWYRRAGQPVPTGSLHQEWEALVDFFLAS